MMQGDAYSIPVVLRQGATVIVPDMVKAVEITLGNLTRCYPGDVTWNEEAKQYEFPLTQEQTLKFPAGEQPLQVRVKFLNDEVVGAQGGSVDVKKSISKGVL